MFLKHSSLFRVIAHLCQYTGLSSVHLNTKEYQLIFARRSQFTRLSPTSENENLTRRNTITTFFLNGDFFKEEELICEEEGIH